MPNEADLRRTTVTQGESRASIKSRRRSSDGGGRHKLYRSGQSSRHSSRESARRQARGPTKRVGRHRPDLTHDDSDSSLDSRNPSLPLVLESTTAPRDCHISLGGRRVACRDDAFRDSGHENPPSRNRRPGRVLAVHRAQGDSCCGERSRARRFGRWTSSPCLVGGGPCDLPGCAASANRSVSFAHCFSVPSTEVLPPLGGERRTRGCCHGRWEGASGWMCTLTSARPRSARRARCTRRAGCPPRPSG